MDLSETHSFVVCVISPNPEIGEMKRLLYPGNLFRFRPGTLSTCLTNVWEDAAGLPSAEPRESYRPVVLSVRYSVGVALQIFLKTLQK
jgi:hypothetical protein